MYFFSFFFCNSDFEDIELQVLNAREDNSSSPAPVTTFHSPHFSNENTASSRSVVVEATSICKAGSNQQNCDIIVHRKNSGSSDHATLVPNVPKEKLADLSPVKSSVITVLFSSCLWMTKSFIC